MSYPVQRSLAVLVMLAAVVGLLAVRVLGSPDIPAYRTAMAAAPDGGLYAALAERRFVQVGPDGKARTEWLLPRPTPLALAASGDNLVLGTDGGLWVSVNRGRTWDHAIASGRFLAVAIRGSEALAGAWAQGLWASHDAGATWSRVDVPADDTEFESIAIGDTCAVAATLLGGMVSCGTAWRRTATPDRLTSVDALDGGFMAGSWRGALVASTDGIAPFEPVAGLRRDLPLPYTYGSLGAGVWAVAGRAGLAATTRGLYSTSGRVLAFADREVTAVSQSDGALYAAVARGPIYSSVDGGQSWRVALQR